jgi:hypothetical protein
MFIATVYVLEGTNFPGEYIFTEISQLVPTKIL